MSRSDRIKNKQKRDGTRDAVVRAQCERIVNYHRNHPEAGHIDNLKQAQRILSRKAPRREPALSHDAVSAFSMMRTVQAIFLNRDGSAHFWADERMKKLVEIPVAVIKELRRARKITVRAGMVVIEGAQS